MRVNSAQGLRTVATLGQRGDVAPSQRYELSAQRSARNRAMKNLLLRYRKRAWKRSTLLRYRKLAWKRSTDGRRFFLGRIPQPKRRQLCRGIYIPTVKSSAIFYAVLADVLGVALVRRQNVGSGVIQTLWIINWGSGIPGMSATAHMERKAVASPRTFRRLVKSYLPNGRYAWST